jgi:hypothetical protein
VFTAAGYFTNQTFTLPLSGLAGKSYVLQASTNLVNWVSIGTNVAGSSQFQMTDTNAPNVPYQFYRVLEQP